MTPTVLQVLPSLNQGGVERATLDMAQALLEDNPNSPIYIASAGGVYIKGLPDQVIHITLPLNCKNPLVMISNALRLTMLIRKYDIQIVHARSRAPAWSALLACKLSGILGKSKGSFITTYHAAYRGKSRFKKLYNSVMARGDAVITISDFMENHVKTRYPLAKTHLIREGIDEAFFMPQEDQRKDPQPLEKAILLPSRLSPTKGIFTALEAMKIITKNNPLVKLLLIRAGKESLMHEVDAYIEKNNLKKNVEFLPSSEDLRPYYDRASVIIVPSLVPEAFGRVAVEGMLMEKIVIATNIGALTESIMDNKTGFLMPVGNPHTLAEKITYVLNLDDSEKIKISKAARKHALTHFSLRVMKEKTIHLYKSIYEETV